MNKTLLSFNFKKNTLREYKNWFLLLRPEQVTAGALVLISKSDKEKFSDLDVESRNEYSEIILQIENVLEKVFNYQKVNYLTLMMVDPHVHTHIVPRYDSVVAINGNEFKDFGWPGLPDLKQNNSYSAETFRKIKEELVNCLNDLYPKKKYNRIYTTGAFDIFHYGHLNILRESKKMCEELIVGVSTDELIESAKGRKAVIPYKDRADIIASLNFVDKVIPQEDKDKEKVVKAYNIDAISVGDDWKGKYPEVSCEMEYIKYTEEISSTKIRTIKKL